MINEPVPVLSQTRRSPADHANPRGHLAYSGSNPGPATTSQNNPWPARTRSGGCPVYAVCVVSAGPSGCLGPGVGVVPGLFSRVVVTCRLAEPARACCRGEDGSVLIPLHGPGLRCRGSAVPGALPRHQTAHAALLADILDVLHGASPAARQEFSLPPAEELSPGELRVLRYLPTNLSRPEIAGQLSVSPNTVSAHIRSIYAKLGVGDRSAAVRRARQLRLLAAAGQAR